MAAACVAGPLLVVAAWLGIRGWLAYSRLSDARAQISELQQRLLAGDVPDDAELSRIIGQIGQRTRSAAGLTGDPVWSAAAHLPWAGCPLRGAHQLADAVAGVATEGLPAVADAAAVLDPATLRTGMTINLVSLRGGAEPVARAISAVDEFRAALRAVPDCVDGTRDAALGQADRLASALAGLRLAIELGPSMLGGDGERRYLLVVQNPAESRANGGIIGAFGLLTARDGTLSLDGVSGNGQLPQPQPRLYPPLPTNADLPPELADRYGPYEPTRIWANSNLTPDYPTASRFYTGQYLAGTGVRVDGTVSIDPTALSYLLAATKPAVLPDGRVIRADELVRVVASDVYAQIDDPLARDEFFADVGEAVYEAVTAGGEGSTPGLLRALGRAVGEGRLLVASNHEDEQRLLATTPLGGALPTAPGPFLAVLTQNAAASKLDYWLRREVDYHFQPVPAGKGSGGIATITIRLLNAAPDGLPEYVRYRLDRGGPGGNQDAQNQVWLSVYTGVGSQLLDARLDGERTTLDQDREREHPVLSAFVPLDRGRPRTLVLHVWEPQAGPALTVREQPLVTPEKLTVRGLPTRSPWVLDTQSHAQ
ncbi:MAG: DUF4012 domain-containing protein [Frankia sp.]|nr:DUF4012 domain-containing protein [Frankia sp.]